MTNKSSDKKRRNPGPNPGRVKTDKPWEKTISDALKKKRPDKGWPKRVDKNE